MNPLHFQVKKLQKLLINEQGTRHILQFAFFLIFFNKLVLEEKYSILQKRLQESENQRLELISQSNKETFNLNTQLAKLRADYEKNEAQRQTLEYELTLAKTSCNKEKQSNVEKEKASEELTKSFQEQIKMLHKELSELKQKMKNDASELSRIDADRQKISSINEEQEKY